MLKLGSHVSFKKPDYLFGAIKQSLKNGANTTMIFLGPPQSTFRAKFEDYKYFEYKAQLAKKIAPEDIIVHAPYIINPSNPTKSQFSNDFLIQEIRRMNHIGAKILVLHPGSYTTFLPLEAKKQLISSLKFILENTENVVISLETMAGKGTEICTNFEEIVEIVETVNSPRVKICLDTCHVWDAGYNLKKYEEFCEKLVKTRLINYLNVIHLNDSASILGSRKDRHANIGKGFIGLEVLKKIVHDPLFADIPKILETPFVDNKPIYDEEIALLLRKD
ncbi:deoxyribonuclease IV [Mycoplasma sp. 'Moose RK']|uniref:deoxyribonuclease IV n=1 Tax=Mycoplasma sp. 'Moose RK' TaxID=2780095 RepID=UPI0018C1DE9E|nr:deoxyribonuclease IV [Mycoplasma sp. 'Moose RK']MBG0731033.1 deoxyribonuclease IV [Mycoplasma sp. 'Moose RK']